MTEDHKPNTVEPTSREPAWVKLYAGTLEVRIPLPITTESGVITEEGARFILESIANLKAAGFSETLPDQKPGQMVEEVSHVVVSEKANDDGTMSPVIYYYPSKDFLVYRAYGKHYLDTPEDRAEFEQATGLKLSTLTNIWPSAEAPKRDDPKAASYFYALKTPIQVAFEPNPRYNPEEKDVSKKKAQFNWGGYLGQPVVPNRPMQTSAAPPQSPPSANSEAASSGASGKGGVDYNKAWPLIFSMYHGTAKDEAGSRKHAQSVHNKLVNEFALLDPKTASTDALLNLMRAYKEGRESGAIPQNPTKEQIEDALATRDPFAE